MSSQPPSPRPSSPSPRPSSPSPTPSSPSQNAAIEHLRALVPLVQKLATSLTCSVCLDVMQQAHQLQCSHIFCVVCAKRMLSMSDVRCPICKQKTGKRMLSPLISFSQASQTLHSLRQILQQCDIQPVQQPRTHSTAFHDGFDAALSSAVRRIQQVQREQRLRLLHIQQQGDNVRAVGPPLVCALCPKGVDPSFFAPAVQFGQLKRAPSKLLKQDAFAHENCALYSAPYVYQLDDHIQGLDTAIANNCHIACQRQACGRKRANVSCASSSCSNTYHFACAVVDKCVFVEDGYKMFCPQHVNQAPTIDDKQFTNALSDPKGNVSRAHDDACYICYTGGRLLMCDTCERCTHAACSGLRSIPNGSWSCAVCTKSSTTNSRASSRKRPRTEHTVERSERPADTQLTSSSLTPGSAKRARSGTSQQRKKSDGSKRMVLSHTGLCEADRELLRSVAKSKKTILKEDVDAKVTHLVIRCLHASEKPLRTMKLCKAIASRARIVCWTWVQESQKTAQWAPFERHVHRLSWEAQQASVYATLQVSFGCYNGPREKKEELTSLVHMGGGTVVQREASSASGILFVREEDGRKNGRREQRARTEPPRGARVVAPRWLLDLCTKNRLQ